MAWEKIRCAFKYLENDLWYLKDDFKFFDSIPVEGWGSILPSLCVIALSNKARLK
jgi:hypothetical protein